MIGAAKTALSSAVVIISPYSCFISPEPSTLSNRKGFIETPNIHASVVGGVGPFDYLWEVNNQFISISEPNNVVTKFLTSIFGDAVEGVITLTVTDTGNSDNESVATSVIVFDFE